MTQTALVITDMNGEENDFRTFLATRNIKADAHHKASTAFEAFRTGRYRYVLVSMDNLHENPIEIMAKLRRIETELGLQPASLLAGGYHRQPSSTEMKKYQVCGLIRFHQMK